MSHEVERFFAAVDPDRVATEYLEACAILSGAGYAHYEVSNFARPGFESLHNRVYWDNGDYLGLGPAAHSSLGGRRFWNEPLLAAYVSRRGADHVGARVADEGGDDTIERTMLALRTNRGAQRGALTPDQSVIDAFVRDGLITLDGERVFATDSGYLVLNELVLRLSEGAPC
jgi:oxygen-independent coproporphyrinogen-3 oxidase